MIFHHTQALRVKKARELDDMKKNIYGQLSISIMMVAAPSFHHLEKAFSCHRHENFATTPLMDLSRAINRGSI